MDALPDGTLSALRQKHGVEADAKIAAAHGLIAQAAQRWPGVWNFLDASGLANDPRLIEQLAARAERRRGAAERSAEQNRDHARRWREQRRRSRT